MIAWLVAAALTGQAPATPVFSVRQTGGGLGVDVDEIAVVAHVGRADGGAHTPGFWIVEQHRGDTHLGRIAADGTVLERYGWTWKHRWIDGRTCPPLADVAQEIDQLSARIAAQADGAKRLGLPLVDLPEIPASDTPIVQIVRVDGRAHRARLHDLGYATAQQLWWRSSRSLERCWQSQPPQVDGQPVQPLIPAADLRRRSEGSQPRTGP